jgi:hypothetical protein
MILLFSEAVPPSSQAPVQFGGNYFSTSDLQTFEQKYVPAVTGQKVNQVITKHETC